MRVRTQTVRQTRTHSDTHRHRHRHRHRHASTHARTRPRAHTHTHGRAPHLSRYVSGSFWALLPKSECGSVFSSLRQLQLVSWLVLHGSLKAKDETQGASIQLIKLLLPAPRTSPITTPVLVSSVLRGGGARQGGNSARPP